MPLIPNLLVPERSPKYLRGLTRSYQCQFGALPKISLLVMFFSNPLLKYILCNSSYGVFCEFQPQSLKLCMNLGSYVQCDLIYFFKKNLVSILQMILSLIKIVPCRMKQTPTHCPLLPPVLLCSCLS